VASLSAFAGCAPVVPAHESARAVPLEPLATLSVAAWPGQTAALGEALHRALALELPEAGRWTHANGLLAIWMGPDHFYLQREGAAALLPELAPVVGDLAALIDLTDARATLRLTGPAAREILAGLLPLDLHRRGFAPGRAASTIAGHMTVQLRQIDAAPSYDLAVGRSFAGSLWRALELAGAGRLRLG